MAMHQHFQHRYLLGREVRRSPPLSWHRPSGSPLSRAPPLEYTQSICPSESGSITIVFFQCQGAIPYSDVGDVPPVPHQFNPP